MTSLAVRWVHCMDIGRAGNEEGFKAGSRATFIILLGGKGGGGRAGPREEQVLGTRKRKGLGRAEEMVLWSYGPMVLWSYGPMVLW
ncbi:hypothetical protein BOO24_16330 [Vibrio navarrensis]|nr:hypothetical protein [Vibrio navarrensis]